MINLKATVDFFVEETFNYPTLAEVQDRRLDAWNGWAKVSQIARGCGDRELLINRTFSADYRFEPLATVLYGPGR